MDLLSPTRPSLVQRPQSEQHVTYKTRQADFWNQETETMYPEYRSRTYFVPPVHFNRVSYSWEHVHAVKVRLQQPCPNPCHLREDQAHQRVLHTLRQVFQNVEQPMIVLSKFEPVPPAESLKTNVRSLLNRTAVGLRKSIRALAREMENVVSLGDRVQNNNPRSGKFDILIIHKDFGFVVGKIHTMGTLSSSSQFLKDAGDERDKYAKMAARVRTCLRQLGREVDELRRLLAGADVTIRTVLVLPDLTQEDMRKALRQNRKLQTAFAGDSNGDWEMALKRCIFSEHLPPEGRAWEVDDDVINRLRTEWWTAVIGSNGQPVQDDLYLSVIARLCGPGTSPRRADITTLHDAVLHTAQCMLTLTLTQTQMDMVRSSEKFVFIKGPPCTGKQVMLILKAVQWLQQGHTVHVLALWDGSEATARHVYTQILLHCASHDDKVKLIRGSPTPADLSRVVGELRNAADRTRGTAEEVKVIVPEAPWFFPQFFQKLKKVLDDFSLWASSRYGAPTPSAITSSHHGAPIALAITSSHHGDHTPQSNTSSPHGAPANTSSHHGAPTPQAMTPSCSILEGMMEFHTTHSMSCPPVVVRELESCPAYTGRAMLPFTPLPGGVESGLLPPTDGPPVKRIYHSQHAQSGLVDVWECSECGAEVGRFLTGDLAIGTPLRGDSDGRRDTLKFKDVLISGHITLPKTSTQLSTRDSIISTAQSDTVHVQPVGDGGSGKDALSEECSPQWSGFLQGLAETGVPCDVIAKGDNEAVDRLVSPDEVDLAHVAEPVTVFGLQRPVVVVIGTNDIWQTRPEYVDPRFDVIACCTSQLVLVEGF